MSRAVQALEGSEEKSHQQRAEARSESRLGLLTFSGKFLWEEF